MNKIQNPKQLAFDLICNLVLVICYFQFIQLRCLIKTLILVKGVNSDKPGNIFKQESY